MSLLFETKFPLGKVVVTLGGSELLKEAEQNPLEFVERHARLDRGTLSQDDWNANFEALKNGERIFSAFKTEGGDDLWVITEADRSITTVLLPEEY